MIFGAFQPIKRLLIISIRKKTGMGAGGASAGVGCCCLNGAGDPARDCRAEATVKVYRQCDKCNVSAWMCRDSAGALRVKQVGNRL